MDMKSTIKIFIINLVTSISAIILGLSIGIGYNTLEYFIKTTEGEILAKADYDEQRISEIPDRDDVLWYGTTLNLIASHESVSKHRVIEKIEITLKELDRQGVDSSRRELLALIYEGESDEVDMDFVLAWATEIGN